MRLERGHKKWKQNEAKSKPDRISQDYMAENFLISNLKTLDPKYILRLLVNADMHSTLALKDELTQFIVANAVDV